MKIQIINQSANILELNELVSNSVEIYNVQFTFDESWDGFAKTAVFQLDSEEPIEMVLINDSCKVPQEVLTHSGYLNIGVYGVNGVQRMPTVWNRVRILLRQGTPSGSPSIEPTPWKPKSVKAH